MLGNVESLAYLGPEGVLTATIVALFFLNFATVGRRPVSATVYSNLALAGIVISLLVHVQSLDLEPSALFSGMILFDGVGAFLKFLFGLSAILAILFSQKSNDLKGSDAPSYYILLLVLVLGMNFLAMAANLLMIYLSLEMVSISSYLLTGYVRGVRRSSEAALKYVIYGGVASGVMIYGFSLLYGLTGTMQLSEIAHYLQFHPIDRGVLFLSLLLTLVGFGFKIAAFPFHMWSPDVYEGAPTAFTAFLSVGPKAAGFAVLVRFIITAFFMPEDSAWIDIKSLGVAHLIAVLSAATMTFGNLAALNQENIKRLLAYSSIAHAGYMLMAVAAMNEHTLPALLFYLAIYLVMNLGAFLVAIIVANQFGLEEISGYKGLGRRAQGGAWVAVAMTIFLFSLTGLPPTAGFIGKFYIFAAVMHGGLYWLAIVGALNSVISLYYYARVAKVMFFDDPTDDKPLIFQPWRYTTILGVLAGATLFLGLYWEPLVQWTQDSASLFLITKLSP